MQLTYTGDQIDRFIEAQDKGLHIVEVRHDWVLSLDLDNKDDVDRNVWTFQQMWAGRDVYVTLPRTLWVPDIHPLITFSQSGENAHVYIAVTKEWANLSDERRAEIAVFMGSDPAREKYCLERNRIDDAKIREMIAKSESNPAVQLQPPPFPPPSNYVMFETPAAFQIVKTWHSINGLICTEIGPIDKKTKTYNHKRHFPTTRPKKGLESLYGYQGYADGYGPGSDNEPPY